MSVDWNVTRRAGLSSLAAGLIASSCAGTGRAHRSRYSAADMLDVLARVQTISTLTSAMGWGGVLHQFDHDDPENSYHPFRRPKGEWARLHVFSRSDLLDRVSRGTEMRTFSFYYNQPMNPTSGMIAVFSDDTGNIIGWLYSRTLVGHEREAMLG